MVVFPGSDCNFALHSFSLARGLVLQTLFGLVGVTVRPCWSHCEGDCACHLARCSNFIIDISLTPFCRAIQYFISYFLEKKEVQNGLDLHGGRTEKDQKKKEDPKESERNSYMYAISTIAFLFPPSEVHPPHTYSPSASHSKGISNTRLSRSSLTRLTMAASGEGSSLSRSKKWTFFGRGGKR